MIEMTPTRTDYAVEDRRWLRDLHGLTDTIGATLNPALFTASDFPDGLVRSGTVLAQVADSRLYGPYEPGATDGRATARGHLLDTTTVRATSRNTVAMFDHGAVLRDYLPVAAGKPGAIDTAAETSLARVRYTNGKGA